MTISKRDYNKLCKIARYLCDIEHEDYDYDQLELWEMLNEVIENIKD